MPIRVPTVLDRGVYGWSVHVPSSPPTLKVLQRIADVYGRDLREIMHEAGFVFETPADLDAMEESLDARFLRLVTHPALRPMRMDALVIEMIPPLVKRQWIEFARKLEEHLLDLDHEVVDAIHDGNAKALEGELGDLLLNPWIDYGSRLSGCSKRNANPKPSQIGRAHV